MGEPKRKSPKNIISAGGGVGVLEYVIVVGAREAGDETYGSGDDVKLDVQAGP